MVPSRVDICRHPQALHNAYRLLLPAISVTYDHRERRVVIAYPTRCRYDSREGLEVGHGKGSGALLTAVAFKRFDIDG